MANQRKRFEFDNTFGCIGRSPKRPKLDVIEGPSASSANDKSFVNIDENDELWGDEIETDVVKEVLLLETQACSQVLPDTKLESVLSVSSTAGSFRPKTATFPRNLTGKVKESSERETHRSGGDSVTGKDYPRDQTGNVKDCGAGDVFKSGEVNLSSKDHKLADRRFLNPHPKITSIIQPLVVEKVKSNVVGKGCARSNSMPSFEPHNNIPSTSKPWTEFKDLSRKISDVASTKKRPQQDVPSTSSNNIEITKNLQKEIEKLRSEAFTKAGEASLLRQKIKDASMDLEREKQYRASILEKINQKHQQEISALNRELEAAKTQLEFKELDVDKAVEKCKLLESGSLRVRPMELKLHTTLRGGSGSEFPNRSTFEDTTPKKKMEQNSEKRRKSNQDTPNKTKCLPVVMDGVEIGVQTDEKLTATPRPNPELFSEVSEGDMLSRLIVPAWFEMDSGATEEEFESKWEGVSAITELFKSATFEGEPLMRMVEWFWKRLLAFLSILRKRSEDDYKYHRIREESRRQYEEWCLDRRIPLPPQKQSIDEGLREDWFCDFAEDSVRDEMQCLLSYRPWCPKDVMPEIRRTLALIAAMMKVSSRVAPIFSSHNQSMDNENNFCYICGSYIKKKSSEVDNANQEQRSGSKHSGSEGAQAKNSYPGPESNSSGNGGGLRVSETADAGCTPTCPAARTLDGESQKEVDVDGDHNDFLKFDFIHLVQQICKVVSGMRRVMPMEGTLAGALVFLCSLNEQLVLSRRGLLLVSAVIKDILFVRPHLRILPLFMKLLTVTGGHPLILQKMCVNAAWNTAYRDRWKNIWMFRKGVCPLQVLITVLENVTDERIPVGVPVEVWCKFRAKLGQLFVKWLSSALTQPGHQVDWLCYAFKDEKDESAKRRNEKANQNENACVDSSKKDEQASKFAASSSDSSAGKSNAAPTRGDESNGEVESMETEDRTNSGEAEEGAPYNTLSQLSISKLNSDESDNEKEEVEMEMEKKCCCRRWVIDILVSILFAVMSDFQRLASSDYALEFKAEADRLPSKSNILTISNKLLMQEQSYCLRLGIFVLRDLLRRGHPELNTPGGEGFLWNHYTVKGTILINGQIVTKDYSRKNTHGGPIGGRYVRLLTKIKKQLKDKIADFCPETEKALQELLEVEYALQSPSEDDEEEESNVAESMKNLGCNVNT